MGNVIVLFSGPVIGAIADQHAWKKRFLIFTTIGCIVTTGLLGFIGEGDFIAGVTLLTLSLVMFASGENLIAAFLPEIAPDQHMGRVGCELEFKPLAISRIGAEILFQGAFNIDRKGRRQPGVFLVTSHDEFF